MFRRMHPLRQMQSHLPGRRDRKEKDILIIFSFFSYGFFICKGYDGTIKRGIHHTQEEAKWNREKWIIWKKSYSS